MTALIIWSVPALAQYDRDGRYVPSPMGKPADPYARPIPNYSGTPGAAIGEPIVPRGAINPPPIELAPRLPDAPAPRPIEALPPPLTKAQCSEDWSRATRMTPSEFKRRCSLILRRKNEG